MRATSSRTESRCYVAGRAFDNGPFAPISTLIENCVDRYPDRPAFFYAGADAPLRYRELDTYANGLAARFVRAGIVKGDVVPVMMINGLEMPLAYYALMKLGAAFVPFDPAWPHERIAAALQVLSPKLLVCTECASVPAAFRTRALVIDLARIEQRPGRPRSVVQPADWIYGIFTSGTTGVPKCAMNRHAGLTNRFLFMTRYFGATPEVTVLQNSKHTFDSSVWQLFWPLTVGGCSVIPAQGEFLDLEHTVETIARYRVTMTDFVPTIFNALVALAERDPITLKNLGSLRQLVVGGEEMNLRMVTELQALLPGLRVVNGYGPTEASIGMVFHSVSAADGKTAPLGRPIDNCYAMVADEALQPLRPGTIGEIVIGGVCLGDGYYGDAARTREVFVPNPFAEIPGDRLYRTGDFGYFDDQGYLCFVGRKDFQVKIGGVRIELSELEAGAQAHPLVRDAKALVGERSEHKVLALFVAAAPELDEPTLREHLRRLLPRNSMPRELILLTEMPLTDNGKVDRRALQARLAQRLASNADLSASIDVAVVPAGRVLNLFRSALGRADLNPRDDFMAAGGDSLRALSLITALRQSFQVPLSVQDLFDHPSAEAMHACVESRRAGAVQEPDALRMERDTAMPADIVILQPGAITSLREVLLTGATGFVGSRLLAELLRSTEWLVLCLCRAVDPTQAKLRLIEALAQQGLWHESYAPRLTPVIGDLARPALGLDAATWDTLARRCDAIIHNGALVNFLFDYEDHRATNVLGTHMLLRLATARRPKPLHYISTLGVLDCEAAQRREALTEDHDPAGAIAPKTGYSRSKWVAERLLLDARRRGAVVTVLRLGEVMPSADNGIPNARALTHFLLAGFRKLGLCPDVPLRSDYTPVDYVAARVVAALVDPQSRDRTLHVFHPQSVDFTEVWARAGVALRRVTCSEFLAALEQALRQRADTELTTLRTLLPRGIARDEGSLRAAFGSLLVENARLFRKDRCRELERRHEWEDPPIDPAIDAYCRRLSAAEPRSTAVCPP